MAKQKFELAKLDSKNLKELDGFTVKMKGLVKENPFVEITDRKTYEEAKKARTSLKSGRTEVQKQDRLIGTFLSKFRKETKSIAETLVEIVSPSEDKQQTEIDRWELILEEEKNEKERMEKERIDLIEKNLKEYDEAFDKVISNITIDNIETCKEDSAATTTTDFDFEEYQANFDVMITTKESEFEKRVEEVKAIEERRLSDLANDRQNKLNEVELHTSRIIDETIVFDPNLRQDVVNYFNGVDYDFGEKTKEFDEMTGSMLLKVDRLNERLIEDKKRNDELEEIRQKNAKLESQNIQRQKIKNVGEGLLDKIHQMTIENTVEETNYIKEALSNRDELDNELDPEFDEMASRVERSLKDKLEVIAEKLQIQKEKEEAEEKRMELVMDQRTKVLKDLGMEVNEDETQWTGFGLTYDVATIYDENDFEVILDEVKIASETDEKRTFEIKKIGFVWDEEERIWKGFDQEVEHSVVLGLTDEDWKGYSQTLEDCKKEYIETNVKEKERQNYLKPIKEQMISMIDNQRVIGDIDVKFEGDELKLWNQLIEKNEAFCQEAIELIKKH